MQWIYFQIVYSKLTDLLPSAITSEDDPELQRPSMEEIEENTEKTRQALEKLTQVRPRITSLVCRFGKKTVLEKL